MGSAAGGKTYEEGGCGDTEADRYCPNHELFLRVPQLMEMGMIRGEKSEVESVASLG